MMFTSILLICILQNVASSPYEDNRVEIQSRRLEKYRTIDNKRFTDKTINGESSDLSSESRRIFEWIKNILNENKTIEKIKPKTPSYEVVLNERIRFRQIERNLTETLTKLSQVLTQILNIVKYARYDNFENLSQIVPSHGRKRFNKHNRSKRDVNHSNKDGNKKPEGLSDKNVEDRDNIETSTKAGVADSKNGRRVMLPHKSIVANDEVKNRLFKYIDEAFTDIGNKIDSLQQTKQMFSEDANFRIGYIISNIDTLEVNMKNLRLDMDKNKSVWDDRKILNLYDTVKLSNKAITDLLEILKGYVEKTLN